MRASHPQKDSLREVHEHSSALNLGNAPNRIPAGALQRMLGGEHHENRFCTCRSRRAWRRCTLCRAGVRVACRYVRSGLAVFIRCAGGLRLQRMGPLLAPALLRRRLLPSALLASLASALLRRLGIRRLASLAPLVPVVTAGERTIRKGLR